jgi:hypothetical protein
MLARGGALQTELSHSPRPARLAAAAVTGHSTASAPDDRCASDTAHSMGCDRCTSVNDRLEPRRTGAADPKRYSAHLDELPENRH